MPDTYSLESIRQRLEAGALPFFRSIGKKTALI